MARAIRAGSPEAIIGSRRPRALLLVLSLVLGALMLGAQPVNATLQLLRPSPTDPSTFSGKGGYSADGLGQVGTGGTVQAQVPLGSSVVQAYLYGTYFGTPTGPSLTDRTLDFDGPNVVLQTLANSEPGNSDLYTARADVTNQVATKVGTGGGITNFAVNTDPASLDGVALVVIFSNPALPNVTIAVLDGGSKPTGDQITFNFAGPINPTAAGFSAILSLGSGFSFQGNVANLHDCGGGQFSIVKVNGAPLTACAGNYDDGTDVNGGLITVGGVGDATDNPAAPTTQTGTDDELYNLVPLMTAGDTQLVIDTDNPSGDDNLFLAVIQVTAAATVTTEICNNGIDDDGDGLIDGADPDCQQPGPDDASGFATGEGATTVSTSSSDPVQFSRITVPPGVVGEVTMHEVNETTCSLVVARVRCIGERLDLHAPSASASHPLVLEIFVGKAGVPKKGGGHEREDDDRAAKKLVLYHLRDGATRYELVPACRSKPKGAANPAPSCVSSIKAVKVNRLAYWRFTVYTVVNGSWRPGAPR